MNPFEKANNKAGTSDAKSDNQINNSNFELAVHSIIKRRKGTSRDEQIDSCIVKSIGDGVHC